MNPNEQNNQPNPPAQPMNPTQPPVQPQFQPLTQPQQIQQPQPTTPFQNQSENPGETLGIIALILSLLIAPVGLILGIIARSKSKKAGHSNGLALAAIIISALMIFAFIGLFIYGVFVGYNEAAREAKTRSESSLSTVEGQNESSNLSEPAAQEIDAQVPPQAYSDWLEVVRNSGYGSDLIYFQHLPDSAEYNDSLFVKEPLGNIADYATNNPTVPLYIVGAINDDSNSADGYELSRQRAIKTATELVNRGVSKERIKLYAGGSYTVLFGFEALTEASARVSVITIGEPESGTEATGL